MDGWRNDLTLISEFRGGDHSQGWRNEITTIARYYNISPSDWRSNVRELASLHGLDVGRGWRNDISYIAERYGIYESMGWRQMVKMIREAIQRGVEPIPVERFQFNTLDGYRFVTTDGSIFKVR